MARQKIIQARAECQLVHFADSSNLLTQAEQVAPPEEKELQAELALARGICAIGQGNLPIAGKFFEQGAKLSRDQYIKATSLVGVGYVLLKGEQFDQAIDALTQATQLSNSPFILQKAFGNLSVCFSELGDYKRAIAESSKAVKLASSLGADDDLEAWLLELGHSYYALSDVAQSELNLLKALAIARRLHDTDTESSALNNLTELYISDKNLSKAHETWKQEVNVLGSQGLNNSFASLDEGRIASEEKEFDIALKSFDRVLHNPKATSIVRSIAQRETGRILAAQGKLPQAEQMFRQGIKTAEDAACSVHAHNRLTFLDKSLIYDAYVEFLLKHNKKEMALGVSERGRSRALYDCSKPQKGFTAFDVAALQKVLKQRQQIVLSYWVTSEESYLWAITPDKFQVFFLPGQNELGRQQQAQIDEIQSQRKLEESPSGAKFYETLVAPAAGMIPQNAKVIIIPSRTLCPVNFETLVVPGQHLHYWIEDVEVENASSIAAILNAKPHSNAPKKELLLVGNPLEVSPEFPALKHADEEMRRIESHFSSQQESILSGKDATPQSYAASDPGQFRFIHFVTHGTANEVVPMESAIILSGPQDSYKLYGHDILTSKLNADLVTISACYGAGKRWYLTETTVGMEWAFLRAGARQVIAALWEVDDTITPKLMDSFYGDLKKGRSAATALRKAKLAILHSDDLHKRPYFWASLQLYSGS
ncbi:MAG TPA: CHAT domain-containing protein [Candidatus Angelobacter sp.]|nr:CHAT domain-containing protein [Candidatus Angelobacter sp.]